MNAYFDTSVLVKIYYAEPNSHLAATLFQAEPAPIPLTHFQEFELRNSLRLKIFRQELTDSTAKLALASLERDIRNEFFIRPIYSLASVFQKAETLSTIHTSFVGARTIDILHVAAAMEIGCKRFVSFDQRQRKVAAKAGLRVVPR